MSGLELYGVLVAAITTSAIAIPLILFIGGYLLFVVMFKILEFSEYCTVDIFFGTIVVALLICGMIWL